MSLETKFPRCSPSDFNRIGRAEVDTRADTTCAGATFVPLEFTGKECDVGGFHDTMKPIRNVPIATCATAYDHPEKQETLILVFHETLYFGSAMEHSHLNPNQIRANGLAVDSCPRQYDKSSLHAIVHPQEDLTLPFQMYGCISYLPTRLPTNKELESCRYVDMTCENEWMPYSESFQEYERQFRHMSNDAIDSIKQSRQIGATVSSERRCEVDPAAMADRLGVSYHISSATLKCTTQMASRNITDPFVRRVRTRQSPMRYPHLADRVYSDTLFSTTVSRPRLNTCAQLFVTSQKFVKVYPMKTKGDAGDRLNQFITSHWGSSLMVQRKKT